MNKGIVPALVILGILAVAVGAPGLTVAVDKISGKDIGPDHPVYGIERAGEAIGRAFGITSDEELAAEREEEASEMEGLAGKYPERAEEYRQRAQELREEAQENRNRVREREGIPGQEQEPIEIEEEEIEETPTGNFMLLVSDTPADIEDFESLIVSFSKTRIFGSEEGFEEHSLNGTSVDLTQVVGEKAISVLNIELAEGTYNKVEMHVSEVNGTVNGTQVDVKVPSNKLQIVRPFEIKANETTKFVFDINVVRKGNTDEYNLLPVIGKSGIVGEDLEEIEEAECTIDEDCEENETCVEGECEEAEFECTEDADCQENETCVDGECLEVEQVECTEDEDCEENQTCVEGECEPIE